MQALEDYMLEGRIVRVLKLIQKQFTLLLLDALQKGATYNAIFSVLALATYSVPAVSRRPVQQYREVTKLPFLATLVDKLSLTTFKVKLRY